MTLAVNHQSDDSKTPLWRDPAVLNHLYWEREMSLREVADELDCSKSTVWSWAKRLEIELRPPNSRTTHPTTWTSDDGYTYYSSQEDGGTIHFSQHELIALLAGHSPAEVFDDDTHVHHDLRIPSSFDVPQLDIVGNLDVMDASKDLSGHQRDAHEEPDIDAVIGDDDTQ